MVVEVPHKIIQGPSILNLDLRLSNLYTGQSYDWPLKVTFDFRVVPQKFFVLISPRSGTVFFHDEM